MGKTFVNEVFRPCYRIFEISNLGRLRKIISKDSVARGIFLQPATHGRRKPAYQLRCSRIRLNKVVPIHEIMADVWPEFAADLDLSQKVITRMKIQNKEENTKARVRIAKIREDAKQGSIIATALLFERDLKNITVSKQDGAIKQEGAMKWKEIPGSEAKQGVGRGSGRPASFSLGF